MTTQEAQLTIAGIAAPTFVKLENPNGTSHRLVVYTHSDWDPFRDLSLTDWNQASAGLKAIAKFVARGYTGNEHFFLAAPTEKLEYDNGTGTMAYVSSEYVRGQDDIHVEMGGKKVVVSVEDIDMPRFRGWRRLFLDQGQLYGKAGDIEFTNRGEISATGALILNPVTGFGNPHMYWRCRAAAALLAGDNVSVSVGDQFLSEAESVMRVAQADDKVAAHGTYQYEGRVSARANRGAAEALVELGGVNANVQIAAGELDVPLKNGGTYSLENWPAGKPLHRETAMGLKIRDGHIAANTPAARLVMAQSFREDNLVLDLTREEQK